MKRGLEFGPAGDTDSPSPKRVQYASIGYYGQLSLIEQLGPTGDANANHWLVDLDCFSADWFDRLNDDLSNLADWRTIADQAGSRIVEFTAPEAALLQLLTPALGPLADPEEATGSWLKMRLVADAELDDGIAVDTYEPAPGVTDPALIAASGLVVPDTRLLDVAAPSNPAQAKLGVLARRLETQG
jgi:hypothetical protein